MVIINETGCVLYEVRGKAKGNFADMSTTVKHHRYLAVSEILIIIACKSVDWTQRRFVVCVAVKVEKQVLNTCIANIFF